MDNSVKVFGIVAWLMFFIFSVSGELLVDDGGGISGNNSFFHVARNPFYLYDVDLGNYVVSNATIEYKCYFNGFDTIEGGLYTGVGNVFTVERNPFYGDVVCLSSEETSTTTSSTTSSTSTSSTTSTTSSTTTSVLSGGIGNPFVYYSSHDRNVSYGEIDRDWGYSGLVNGSGVIYG